MLDGVGVGVVHFGTPNCDVIEVSEVTANGGNRLDVVDLGVLPGVVMLPDLYLRRSYFVMMNVTKVLHSVLVLKFGPIKLQH